MKQYEKPRIISATDAYAELRAENEKLWKERDHWHVEQVHAYGNWEDAHKRVIELEAENSKLREEVELVGMAGYLLAMKQLEAENETLRAERDEWHRVAQSKQDIIDHMRDTNAANAKLRELASILCFCMQIHKQCDGCKLNGAKGEIVHDPLLACDGLHEMLQELGIEVE